MAGFSPDEMQRYLQEYYQIPIALRKRVLQRLNVLTLKKIHDVSPWDEYQEAR